ncbi:Lactam utilization protein LamB [Minicystis rosea]|nr:Lactam utilization protein LamB [Minicystis rosea]
MASIDLNVDLGELPAEPAELFSLATTANIACGGHAGDEASMERSISRAIAQGTRIAAHPSYPDRAGFGRKTMSLAPAAIEHAVEAQCRALADVARRLGATVTRVKPHGALYHDAGKDAAIAAAVIDGALRGLGIAAAEATIVGAPTSFLHTEAERRGAAYAREGFADRGYRADGSLVPRSEPGALLTDPEAAAQQALTLARSGTIETLCVHGDTEDAVSIATRVRAALTEAGLLSSGG